MLTTLTGSATALAPTRDPRQGGDDTVLLTQRHGVPSRVSAITSPLFDGESGDGPAPQVGRYRVLRRLGRGGMATVVRALDPEIQREVAIKFLHAELCEAGECRTRFLREARAAGGLSHPNIVVVHDVGEIDGRPYMAMELLGGGSLADELERRHRLPADEVITIGIELALALDYAHARGVVHRDIKPGNVLRDAASGAVKLTDFGIAHLDGPDSEAEHRTRIGDVIGTPQYMSPEQARGDRLDGRSDLFSLGIMLYQMVCGSAPFRGDSMVAVALRIVDEPAPPIAEDLQVPPALCRVIETCLAKLPDQRFQSGRELAEALLLVRSEPEVEAVGSVQRRLRRAGAAALAVALMAGAAAIGCEQAMQHALHQQSSQHTRVLARLVAAQNAALVLDDDWAAVEVAIERLLAGGDIRQLAVADHQGVVRAAARLPEPHVGNSHEVQVPILFQDKRLGALTLGIAEAPLQRSVARVRGWLTVGVGAMALAAALAAWWHSGRQRLHRRDWPGSR